MDDIDALDADLGEALQDGEAELAQAIFAHIATVLDRRYAASGFYRRDAHPKSHGCVRAEFRVDDDLAPDLAHGVFAPGRRYPAWVRFSNGGGEATRHDAEGEGRGMAIKLMGVPGEKLLPDERDAGTQDFVLLSHPTFVVDDASAYLTFIERFGSTSLRDRLVTAFTLGLRGTRAALAVQGTTIANPLETRYWSTVPYRLGLGAAKRAVKYSARPMGEARSVVPPSPGPDFLREAMAAHLAGREARFEFMVQPRASEAMRVEDSVTEWREAEAPFRRVATLTIPPQTFSTPARDAFGENLSFNPWHALPEHKPLGAVNRIRRVVYTAVSKLRHQHNGVPRREPTPDDDA
jgi:hypothetical protein